MPIQDDLQAFLAEWHDPSPFLEVQTSGSTGTPKRMRVRKDRMLNSARLTCDYLGLKKGDKALLCMPLRYIAGKMMEMGIDYSDIIDNSFYKKSYIQNQILGRALLESVLFYDGKCIFSSVSIEEMNFYGVTGKELGGVIEQLRLTDGVEVAIFLYETDKNEYKVSLRSKKKIDVARIAADFGGGGHVRAAGFSAKGNVHSIVNKIGEMIEQQYNEDNA